MDWIRVNKHLIDEPEVYQMAETLMIEREAVVGHLLNFWSWCDDHVKDGSLPMVNSDRIDSISNRNGFEIALRDVNWLTKNRNVYSIPNWDRYMSQGAKVRLLAAERKRASREAMSQKSVTSVTRKRDQIREDKIREYKSTSQISDESKDSSSPISREIGHVDWDSVVGWWNSEIAPKIPAPSLRFLSDKRQQGYRLRLREHPEIQSEVLAACSQLKAMAREGWLTFDWIFGSQNNCVKLLEGAYCDERLRRDLSKQEIERQRAEGQAKYLQALESGKRAASTAGQGNGKDLHESSHARPMVDQDIGS